MTGLSLLYTKESHFACLFPCLPFFSRYCIEIVLLSHFDRGFPCLWWKDSIPGHPGYGRSLDLINFSCDLLFWFLVLAAGWWMLKKLKIKR